MSIPTSDGGIVHGDLYGGGSRGVVLLHGGRFNKESWAAQARILSDTGFRVLAIDFRGYGESVGPGQSDRFTAPLHLDALAAVRFLRHRGVESVAILGASLGGHAAANALAAASPGEIDRIIVLGAGAGTYPEKLTGRKLFIVTRGDSSAAGPRLPGIQAAFERVPGPKELVILEGSAHAQFIFETDQAERLTSEILRFLSER